MLHGKKEMGMSQNSYKSMQENIFVDVGNPRIMYAVKNNCGEIMLSTLSGTKEVCMDCFVFGSKLKFSDLEKEGYSVIKLSVFFTELEETNKLTLTVI
jgi:hypothetical protein